MLSGGNFHDEPIAIVADALALAISEIGALSERRIALLIDASLSGLPAFLTAESGVNSGFMMAQVTAAALASECKVLSHPATVDTIPTDGNREDVVPMSMGAAWKERRVADNVRNILAIELMCSAQGLDCRLPLKPGKPLVVAHAAVREIVAPLAQDRVLTPDIEALSAAVANGVFGRAVGRTVPLSPRPHAPP